MSLTPDDWHRRFTHQAGWTRNLREYLYKRVNINAARRVLEVGCGSGVLLNELSGKIPAALFGLDISRVNLRLARAHAGQAHCVQADAHQIPFPTGTFDLAYCHYLLLWVSDPPKVVAEMARVTHPGGAILLLAEPDYGGRIDYPPDLSVLGDWQRESLRRQGAEPLTGRRLSEFLHKAGLENIETGVIGGQWTGAPSQQEWESEWEVLESDLEYLEDVSSVSKADLQKLRQLDKSARQNGTRILYVPTFYALAVKP